MDLTNEDTIAGIRDLVKQTDFTKVEQRGANKLISILQEYDKNNALLEEPIKTPVKGEPVDFQNLDTIHSVCQERLSCYFYGGYDMAGNAIPFQSFAPTDLYADVLGKKIAEDFAEFSFEEQLYKRHLLVEKLGEAGYEPIDENLPPEQGFDDGYEE